MKDNQIIEMATPHFVRIEYDRGGDHECYEFSSDELITFARLIAKKQREEDARICEVYEWETGKNCAAAIRNSGGAV